MDYEVFLSKMAKDIMEMREDLSVEITKVEKLQENYVGLLLCSNDVMGSERTKAAVNVEPIYRRWVNGEDYNDLIEEVLSHVIINPGYSVSMLRDYESLKRHLILQAVDSKRNEEMLSKVPHIDMDDLSIVFRVRVLSNNAELADGYPTAVINNDVMNALGITRDQLVDDALKYAPMNNRPLFRNMTAVMKELGGIVEDEDSPMWVASVEDGYFGAGVIAYPGFLHEVSEKLGSNFYILPSSIHEVLIIRDDAGMQLSELYNMVIYINETEVAPSELLSDNVYHYDDKSGVFEDANKYVNRTHE